MSEMIEKVAKAIWKIHSSSFSDGIGLEDDLMYEDMARAAIEAMRKPTKEMTSIDDVHWDYSCHICGGLKYGWHKMIDVALSSQERQI